MHSFAGFQRYTLGNQQSYAFRQLPKFKSRSHDPDDARFEGYFHPLTSKGKGKGKYT